jgi:hypothetical protein
MARARRRFHASLVNTIAGSQILGVRAGTRAHRTIGIWAVVVDGRVFVRSWGIRRDGWYSTFLEDRTGVITVPSRKRTIPVRAIPTRSERLKDAVTRAYLQKYRSPGSLKWVRGFRTRRRRDATMELVPR